MSFQTETEEDPTKLGMSFQTETEEDPEPPSHKCNRGGEGP
jgi:hypothetical protein